MLKFLIKAGTTVFIGILAGRLAGFVREALIAASFGANRLADVAVLLLTIPDLFINMLVGGAVGAALIPELKKRNPTDSQNLFIQSTAGIFFCFIVFAAVIQYAADRIVLGFAPGLPVDAVQTAASLLKIVIWSLPVTAATAIATSYLQANEKFVIPAMGTFIFNVVIITFLFIPTDSLEQKLWFLAVGILAAALIRYMSQSGGILSKSIRSRPFGKRELNLKLALKYIQVIGASGFIFFMPVLARLLASFQPEGSIATVNYTMKLIELPLGVLVTVLPVVLFPRLSAMFQNASQEKEAVTVAANAIVFTAIVSITVTLYLFWFRQPFVETIYGWGQATKGNLLENIGFLLSICIFSLPAQGLYSMAQTIFNANGDTKSFLYISLSAVIFYLPFGWILGTSWGLGGIMLSFVLVNWGILIASLWRLAAKYKIPIQNILAARSSMKMYVSVLVPLLFIIFISNLLPNEHVISIMLLLVGCGLSVAGGILSVGNYRSKLLKMMKRGE